MALACSNDKLPEPEIDSCGEITYTDQLATIINNSCAFTGCHVSGSNAPGDFSNYASMLSRLESGLIKDRVITQGNMPIAPGELSAEDLELFKCWIEKDFPE